MGKAYFLKRPSKARRTYALISPEGKTVKSDLVDALNQQLKAGLDLNRAELLAQEILTNYRTSKQDKQAVAFLPENLRLVEDYWNAGYGSKHRVDHASAKYRLERAVKRFGRVSIAVGTQAELNTAISGLRASHHKESVAVVNQLLRYLGRKERLYPKRSLPPDPVSISLKECLELVKHLEPTQALMVKAAFAVGCRGSELFALSEERLRGDRLTIDRQLKPKEEDFTPRKWGKRAFPKVVPEVKESLLAWIRLSGEEKGELRRRSKAWAKWMKKAAVSAGIKKDVTFHCLRHSYVRYWAERGTSLTKLAEYIGDSIYVTELHYKGWVEPEAA